MTARATDSVFPLAESRPLRGLGVGGPGPYRHGRGRSPIHRRRLRGGECFGTRSSPRSVRAACSACSCPGTDARARLRSPYGLVCHEVEAVDSGWRTLLSVQGSLAMEAIAHFGSENQKLEYLPRMATGEVDRMLRTHRGERRERSVVDVDRGRSRRLGLDHHRHEAVDRTRDRRRRRRGLGAHRGWCPWIPRSDGFGRLRCHADHGKARDAIVHPVRDRARWCARAGVFPAAARGRAAGAADVSLGGPVRDHLGCHRDRARVHRRRRRIRARTRAVRQHARRQAARTGQAGADDGALRDERAPGSSPRAARRRPAP